MLETSRNSPRTLGRRSHRIALTYTGTLFSRSAEQLANGSIKKAELEKHKADLEKHYGLLKTQFDAWMKRAIEQKVVKKEPRPGVLYSLNQQPEHTSRPQEQEPLDSSGLYGHFIRSLQERLANGSIKKAELEKHKADLEKHYGL